MLHQFFLPPIINPNSMNPISNVCSFCSVPLFSPSVPAVVGSYSVESAAISLQPSRAFCNKHKIFHKLCQKVSQLSGAKAGRPTPGRGVISDPQQKGKRLNPNLATKVIVPPPKKPKQNDDSDILGSS